MSESTNAVLASPPGECCVKGFKHRGTPVGQKIHVGGLDTYITYPPKEYEGKPKRIILAFPDIFGTFYVNTDLVLDHFASHGFLVIAPDYLQGASVQEHYEEGVGFKEGFDLTAWVQPHRDFAIKATPIWIDAVKAEFGSSDTTYGCLGYCFGAPFVLSLLANGGVSAGAFAHPAFLTEDDFRNIKGPLFLSCAENDFTFPASSRHRAEDILAEIKATYHVQLFSGVQHGFSTKGNPDDPNERWVKEESARGIINWWNRFL
ncbi:alpha/beta-hydrolase [Sistotremastrum suecicum HHB10207 ss-3]|uniref:Alpha/beta-hydrolase n=1 Tax=Sistotremastrum suecicum HHB10207 ss-3 TaxID=1314776 RepID=A0A166D0I6_9AGAM|nr:alpha/beta-hydrolase [Sistotremastrum suecicum HHB10207 ss-3]